MDHMFRDLCLLILKVGLYPGVEVLECTAKFLDLFLKISMRLMKSGFLNFIKIAEHIIATGKRQYYTSNTAKCDPSYYPFGDKLGDHKEYEAWAQKLVVGSKIDAVKFCKNETRAIWSRAVILEIKQSKLYVRFEEENSGIYHMRSIQACPFSISPYGSKSLDFEWRKSLKKGDTVDYFFGRKGWICFIIVEVELSQSQESLDQVTILSLQIRDEDNCEYFSSEDDDKETFGNPF